MVGVGADKRERREKGGRRWEDGGHAAPQFPHCSREWLILMTTCRNLESPELRSLT